MPHIAIAQCGVLAELKKLKPGKPGGPDDLGTKLLQQTAETITPIITHLYQCSLDTASVPPDWEACQSEPHIQKRRQV